MMGRNSRERAQEGSDEFNHRARQSSADFQRGVETSSSTFRSTNESQLGSGRSTTPEPAQAGGGALELTMTTMVSLSTALGSIAAAALIGRRRKQ